MKEENIKSVNPELIHLNSVRVINGSIHSDPNEDESKIKGFETTFNIQQGIDLNSNAVKFTFGVQFNAINSDNTGLNINAEYTMEFVFIVDNLKDLVIKKGSEKDKVLINIQLGGTLFGIVYSTARGIILTRTQGTIIDGLVLPVIDPIKLLTSNKPDKPLN